jgi:hypothetical protein
MYADGIHRKCDYLHLLAWKICYRSKCNSLIRILHYTFSRVTIIWYNLKFSLSHPRLTQLLCLLSAHSIHFVAMHLSNVVHSCLLLSMLFGLNVLFICVNYASYAKRLLINDFLYIYFLSPRVNRNFDQCQRIGIKSEVKPVGER